MRRAGRRSAPDRRSAPERGRTPPGRPGGRTRPARHDRVRRGAGAPARTSDMGDRSESRRSAAPARHCRRHHAAGSGQVGHRHQAGRSTVPPIRHPHARRRAGKPGRCRPRRSRRRSVPGHTASSRARPGRGAAPAAPATRPGRHRDRPTGDGRAEAGWRAAGSAPRARAGTAQQQGRRGRNPRLRERPGRPESGRGRRRPRRRYRRREGCSEGACGLPAHGSVAGIFRSSGSPATISLTRSARAAMP